MRGAVLEGDGDIAFSVAFGGGDDRTGRNRGLLAHGLPLVGHTFGENLLAQRVDGFGRALVRVDGNGHAYVPGAVQVRVVQGGELGLAHDLRVLVAGPTGELHVEERQGRIVEHLAVLVDQCGELRFVGQCGGIVGGIVAALVPQHAGDVEALQWGDMVLVDVAALDVSADGRATPCGLDDANGDVRAGGA